jgi:ribose transport system substrate-binding protein
MKRFYVFSAVCMLMLVVVGCEKSDQAAPIVLSGERAVEQQGSKLTLAVIPKSTGGEFWETVEQGARAAAADLGVEIKWDGTLTETEIAEQTKIIENMINLDVDGMALAPLNRKAMKKAVENAVNAGIPVVVFDSGVDGDAHTSFVATDNVQGGALGGKRMIELLGDEKGKVVVLRFVQGTGSTEARAKGFIETVEAAGIEVLADPYPEDGSVAGAKKTASNTLEAYIENNKLEVDGIFACNLYSALGMAAALDDLRKSGIEVNAHFIGFDTSPELIKGVQEGTIDSLVAQDPKKMGYMAVETITKHLRGETVDAIVDTGVELVTKGRIETDADIRKLVGLE